MQVTCCERLIHSDMYRIIRIDANNKHKERIFMHERLVCLGKPGNNTNQKPWIESPLEGTAQTVIVGGYSGPASGEIYFYFFTFLISILAISHIAVNNFHCITISLVYGYLVAHPT